MSANFSAAFNTLDNPSANSNMATQATQEHTSNSIYDTDPPSPVPQNISHVSSNRINTIRQFGYTLPNDSNIPNYLLPPPEASTNDEREQSVEELFPELNWSLDGNPIVGNSWDGEPMDRNHMSIASSHVQESGSYPTNNTIPVPGWHNYSIDPEPFNEELEEEPVTIAETRVTVPSDCHHYPTLARSKEDLSPVKPNDNRSGRGQIERGTSTTRSESPTRYPTSPDSKVTKSKKTHRCAQYSCGKTFGRTAELKRHMNSVHRDQVADEKLQELFDCIHEGCGRVGELGFKRKDNLVQHLRGVHGDHIGKKSGRKPTAGSNANLMTSNTGPGYLVATGNDRSPRDQQLVMQGEEPGSPYLDEDFYENFRYWGYGV
ncbi:hypothetical protein C7212DRAFT_363796 [Tuber magnatum]|uniref:C2H2-type domain-containing protein n=1 Tax=Tuber magnatum TaxID=42249 RepID=A0A317SSA5_9PEZI|nr:hypothetical protein C7212DRAFT_363796 [Tuber magnatum]